MGTNAGGHCVEVVELCIFALAADHLSSCCPVLMMFYLPWSENQKLSPGTEGDILVLRMSLGRKGLAQNLDAAATLRYGIVEDLITIN